jgi:hypothetical protein
MEVALFSSIVLTVINFLRNLAAFIRKEGNHASDLLTQIAAWLGGIGMVALGSHATMVEGVTFPGTTVGLGALDGWSQILLGLGVSSIAGAFVEAKKALDRSDSAVQPNLLADKAPEAP